MRPVTIYGSGTVSPSLQHQSRSLRSTDRDMVAMIQQQMVAMIQQQIES
jgi:hypothetical protein